MNKTKLKITGIVFLAFLFDIIRPLDYQLLVNVTFLTLIALSLSTQLFFVIFVAFVAGFCQDALTFSSNIFYTIEYPLIIVGAFSLNNVLNFIKIRNHPLISKIIIAVLLILLHSLLSLVIIYKNNFFFFANYFVQSCLFFLLVNNLVEKTFANKNLVFAKKNKL